MTCEFDGVSVKNESDTDTEYDPQLREIKSGLDFKVILFE